MPAKAGIQQALMLGIPAHERVKELAFSVGL
jgi:hypothetical protein